MSTQIILDTKFWTAFSFLIVTASLLLFCLLSFLTQSIDAFRIAPAVFRFPGEVPQNPCSPFLPEPGQPILSSMPGVGCVWVTD